MKISNRI
jgi:hypothetical protein